MHASDPTIQRSSHVIRTATLFCTALYLEARARPKEHRSGRSANLPFGTPVRTLARAEPRWAALGLVTPLTSSGHVMQPYTSFGLRLGSASCISCILQLGRRIRSIIGNKLGRTRKLKSTTSTTRDGRTCAGCRNRFTGTASTAWHLWHEIRSSSFQPSPLPPTVVAWPWAAGRRGGLGRHMASCHANLNDLNACMHVW